MKNNFILFVLFGLVSSLLPFNVHANAQQDLQQADQQATVVSAKKLDGAANYAYDIGFQLGCTLYVARYKSAYDYVPPQALAPNSRVNVRPEKHWLHVFLPPDRNLEMRIVSVSGLGNECHENTAASSTEPLLAGTILPVSLDATIRSDKNRIGDRISATLMQDVPLRSDGISLPKGSTVSGRVVEVVRQGQGSDESRISIQFDQLRFRDRTVPVTTNLRALASAMAVSASQTPRAGNEDSSDWNLVPIGGDQASYGQGGLVVQGSEVVGKSTGQGTLAYPTPDLGTECRSAVGGNTRPQAFWVFSSQACGVYSYGDLKILHSGRTEPLGQITLISGGKLVEVGKGSGMLLRVNSVGDKTASQATIPSQAPVH